MDNCIVRQASLKDAPHLARLLTQLGYPTSSEEMTERLQPLLQRPEYITFVAESGNILVGMVGVHVAFGYELKGPYGRLTGLVVDELFRRHGIGRRLIETVEAWLREHSISLIIVTSGIHRTQAHQFYTDLGFIETGKRFAKHLE